MPNMMRKTILTGLLLLGAFAVPTSFVAAQEKADTPPARAASQIANSNEILKLIQTNKFDDAEKKIDELPSAAFTIKLSMRSMLASALSRAGNNEKAESQEEKLIAEWKEVFQEGKFAGEMLAMPLRNLLQARTGKSPPGDTAKWGREKITELLSLLPQKDDRSALLTEGALESILAEYRANFNLPEEKEKVDGLIAKFQEVIQNGKPEERSKYLSTWINLRMPQIFRKMDTSTEEADAEANVLLGEVATLGEPTTDPAIFNLVTRIRTSVAQRAMRIDPKIAKAQLDSLQEFLEKASAEGSPVAQFAENAKRSTDRMLQSLEMELKRAELIGKKSIPLDAEVFVNGSPITDEELKGKVILLDFWAVWCGPCIATFPHLREWQEKYSDKGLVIIGVTKFYKYDWDEESKRIKSDKELSPENEQKALALFAEHHNLKHRFMVTPTESTFSKDYAVSGIPQAVLIDKDGTIRMIKVGSGDANAHALDEMIQELLGVEQAGE
jgi:thiol-disulfide isomerase/thioredoxin